MAQPLADPLDTEPVALDPGATAQTTALGQLYLSEFGSAVETVVRHVLVTIAGVALYLYAGWWIGPIWTAAYLVSQALAFLAMRRRPAVETPADRAMGYAGYVLTTAIFIALPGFLITTDDIMLQFCGTMGFLTLGVFTLWREEPPPALLAFDIGIAVGATVLMLTILMPRDQGILAPVLMILFAGVALGYYGMALIATRRLRVQLKAAARRGIEAQKMEAIGRLSGGIAHDFNNILTVVQGNLELYAEIEDAAERRALIDEAHRATVRAAGLVAQLLAFARRAPLSATRFEARSVIEEMTALTTRVLPASITIFPAIPAEPAWVRADRDRLLAALLNLVLNARDALPDGGEITLAARSVTIASDREAPPLAPGPYVRFQVCDTGPGMDHEVRARALEPFFSTKPVGAGSGLGLPTAKGFAEQSGGMLSLTSDAQGTVVSLFLPQVGAAHPDPAPAPAPPAD